MCTPYEIIASHISELTAFTPKMPFLKRAHNYCRITTISNGFYFNENHNHVVLKFEAVVTDYDPDPLTCC